MNLFAILSMPLSLVVGLILALTVKKAQDVKYSGLDTAGFVCNIVLIPIYLWLSAIYTFLGLVSLPMEGSAVQMVLGWIVATIIALAPCACGVGLGLSVRLRRQGKSIASFFVQFAGFGGIIVSTTLYAMFVGKLISSLN